MVLDRHVCQAEEQSSDLEERVDVAQSQHRVVDVARIDPGAEE